MKMKIFFSLFFCISITFISNSFAQQPQTAWTAVYDSTSTYDMHTNYMDIDNNGNIYVTGRYVVPRFPNQQLYGIIKYNQDGIVQWAKAIKDITYSSDEDGKTITIAPNGNIYVVGISGHGLYLSSIVLMRLDPATGDSLWSRQIDNGDYNGGVLMKADTSNIYLAFQDNSSDPTLWMYSYSSSGDLRWRHSDTHKSPYSLELGTTLFYVGTAGSSGTGAIQSYFLSDGSSRQSASINDSYPNVCRYMKFKSSGYLYGIGSTKNTGGFNWLAIRKFHADLTTVWSATYYLPIQHNDGYSLAIDSADNVYASGYSILTDTSNVSDAIIIKYNSSGVQQWVSRYNNPIISSNYGSSICIDRLGYPYLLSRAYYNGGFSVIKYNPASGDSLWVKVATGAFYPYPLQVYDMKIDQTGNLFIDGYTGNKLSASQNSAYLLKLKQIPSAPQLISPVNNTGGISITPALDWSDVLMADNYRVQVSADSTFATTVFNNSGVVPSTINVPGGILNNLTKYYWRVNAGNTGGTGQWSAVWSFTTIIAVAPSPVLVAPDNNSVGNLTAISLVWNKAVRASTYRVQLSTDSLFNTLIVNDSTLIDSTKSVSALNPLTSYWWRVNAKNPGGTSAYSAVYKFRTLGVPARITGIFIPANGSVNQPVNLNFMWSRTVDQLLAKKNINTKGRDNSESILNYWFEIATDSVSLAGILRDSTLADTNKTLSGLNNSTNYYWRVKAKNQIGWGAFSFWQKFTTIIAIPPAPFLISPLNNSIDNLLSLTLVWRRALGASTYGVQLSTDSLFNTLLVNDSTLTDSTKSITGLTTLTNYWWRVNAKNIGGTGVYSAAYKFRTMGTPERITGPFIPANGALNQALNINFKWARSRDQVLMKQKINLNGIDDPESITNYWFELSPDSTIIVGVIRDSTLIDTTKTINSLNYSTSYYWRVKAKNQAGWGQFSYWQKFSTLLAPATVNLKIIPGGFYDQYSGTLRMRDTLRVYLIDSATGMEMDSNKVLVDSVTFSVPLSFSNAPTGNYYLCIYHRNHLPVASRLRQSVIRGSAVSFDFTTDSAKAYGFNMIKVSSSPVRWGMIPGDANADEFIDGLDQTIWLFQNGLDGYLNADFNGDGFVDGIDQTIWLFYNGWSSIMPYGLIVPDILRWERGQINHKTVGNNNINPINTNVTNKKK